MAVTLLGIYWIGFALAHAVLLRGLPHGEGIVIDVLVGTFLGDTGAYLGGRLFGKRPLAPHISPNKTVEGLVIGMVFAVLGVWFAGRYQDWLPGTHALVLGLGVALVAPSATCSSRSSSARPAPRTPARSSARTAGRWTGSTRCCSRPSSAITSGCLCMSPNTRGFVTRSLLVCAARALPPALQAIRA